MSAHRGWSPRALTCAALMALLIAGCDNESDSRKDTARKGQTGGGPPTVASTKGPFVTNLSSLAVQSGDFSNDSLVRAILDSAAAGSPKGGSNKWDSKHDRMDSRRLMQGECGPESKSCVPGPFVQIIPRKNVHTNQDLGRGRLVGKLVNLEPNFPYTKLALYKDTKEAYWWVGPRPGGTDTISVYVPSDWDATSKPAKWRSVTVMLTDPGNPTFKHTQSSARFVWNDKDDETWATCVRNGCCQPPVMFDSTAGSTAKLDS